MMDAIRSDFGISVCVHCLVYMGMDGFVLSAWRGIYFARLHDIPQSTYAVDIECFQSWQRSLVHPKRSEEIIDNRTLS